MYPESRLFTCTKEDREMILKELNYTDTMMKADIESIMQWFQKQPHLVEAGITPNMVEFMLLIAKCSVERTKRRIDYYYKYRYNMPEFFSDRMKYIHDPIWDTFTVTPIPKLYKGRRITIGKVLDPDNFNLDQVIMKTFMLADMRFQQEFCLGDIWIIDVENFMFRHLIKMSLISLSKAAMIMHDAIALRIYPGAAILNLFNKLMNKKVFDRIQFHQKIEDLHKFVPKEYLCKEYGGDLPSIYECRDEIEKIMTSEKTKQHLIESCKLQSNESKRPKTDYNEDYLPGNFKKLELD